MIDNTQLQHFRGKAMTDTIFDKILAKKIPADIVFEDDCVLAFKDIHPQASVHVLVIPKRKASSLNDISRWPAEEAGHFLQRVGLVAQKLGLSKSGFRVVMNTGSDGGQTVDYLHAHILGGQSLNGGFA